MGDAVKGKVYLVGAGPGDPGLITVRGRELLETADKVLYDSLVNDLLLKYAPDAEHIFVGKRAGNHTVVQDDINRILVELANQGHRVVRLKGGDPTVFGRISEELRALNEAGISYEIVPGVTAGIAGPAYAGIPVTDRKVSSSVTFITGREAMESVSQERLATQGTLVIYMGMKTMKEMVGRLLECGHAPDRSAAVVQSATTPEQRTVIGTLEDIVERCAQEKIGSPAIIIVGDVVGLRAEFDWFDQ